MSRLKNEIIKHNSKMKTKIQLIGDGNNIFDEQKFKYKAYTTFFDVNPFLNNVISNPINGTSGESQTVDVTLTILPSQVANGPAITPVVNKATSIKIAQMNMGSEFIGKILIQ